MVCGSLSNDRIQSSRVYGYIITFVNTACGENLGPKTIKVMNNAQMLDSVREGYKNPVLSPLRD